MILNCKSMKKRTTKQIVLSKKYKKLPQHDPNEEEEIISISIRLLLAK